MVRCRLTGLGSAGLLRFKPHFQVTSGNDLHVYACAIIRPKHSFFALVLLPEFVSAQEAREWTDASGSFKRVASIVDVSYEISLGRQIPARVACENDSTSDQDSTSNSMRMIAAVDIDSWSPPTVEAIASIPGLWPTNIAV